MSICKFCGHIFQGEKCDICGTELDWTYLKNNSQIRQEQKALADNIIKNTYRVLMSRGMKGCFVYCIDRDLSDHIRKMCKTRFD